MRGSISRLPSQTAPSVVVVALAVVALVQGACAFDPVPLGEDEADAFSVIEGSNTHHLGEALKDGASLTMRDLFERGDGLEFKETPDPSQLLTDTAALDDRRPRAGRVPLTVLTWNVALLDAKIFGFIGYKNTPHLEERRSTLPGLAFVAGYDVILAQEIWLDEDVAEWQRSASDHGYLAFVGDRRDFDTGLMTFVREDILQGGSSTSSSDEAYASQDSLEYFPGPGIKRGYQHTRFVHKDLGPIRVFNTHMRAWPQNWLARAWQSRELGIATRMLSSDDELVLVGGDMNGAPYYKSATWKTPNGGEQDRWFHNTISYALMLVYGELVDLAVMGRPASDAASDVTLGNTVVNDANESTVTPGAEEGWCDRTPSSTFTVSDCNELYFLQYAGTEYPARIDHLMAHDPDGRIVVAGSEVVFTEPERFGSLTIEPSDHYAVAVELLVAP